MQHKTIFMYKQYFLWSLENIWKTASLLIIILGIPITIILAILGSLTGQSFLVLFLGAVLPIIPAVTGEEFAKMLSNIKDIGIFIIPFIGILLLSAYLKGVFLVFLWIAFIVICALAFYAARYVYINFDELTSRQMLYRNSNVGMLDTKWKYAFNRYSHIVAASMYVIALFIIYIFMSIN